MAVGTMGKCALITGIHGQDGHFLGGMLRSKGYRVAGISPNHADGESGTSVCDITDRQAVREVIRGVNPDEIYNLAGISSISNAENDMARAFAVNADGVKNLLEAAGEFAPRCRFFQASSAYVFASSTERKNEQSPFGPTTTYGKTKLAAHMAVAEARKRGMFACCGILFNHESPLRTQDFVTQKIATAAAEFARKKRTAPLVLGNLDAVRDWGYAGDYVEAMFLMLKNATPKDYVIATGKAHTVRDVCKMAFGHVGLDYEGYVRTDPALVRKDEKNLHVGDPALIRKDLNWAAKTTIESLVAMMVDENLKKLEVKA